MHTLSVATSSKTYPIFIGANTFSQLPDTVTSKQVCIVSDHHVAAIYLDRVQSILCDAGKQVISVTLPAGEAAKNHDNLHAVYDALINARFARDACLLALGGGVVGDMAGFAAATYQRGMGFVQVPTTLLAQVDSSVGGKVAVNHRKGKNLIGAFYQPDAVIIDTHTLTTLPTRELNAGLAEVIKYGAIMDASFLTELATNIPKAQAHDMKVLTNIIARCCHDKATIVNADETEKGQRMILNFGHTFGHAIEALTQYQYFLHGEAISIGMMMASHLSQMLGYLNEADIVQLKTLFELAKLPTYLTKRAGLCVNKIYDAMFLDKKVCAGELRLIILRQLGDAFVDTGINAKVVQSAIQVTFAR